MAVTNSESIQVVTRIKNTDGQPHYNHLKKKAEANPDNGHNHVATEINLLIEADYKKSSRKRK